MGLSEGDWVEIAGAVAQVREIDATRDLVIVERASGGRIERPRSFAEMHWQLLDEAGLAVQMAMDPRSVRLAALQSPAEVVVAALIDAGRDGTTMDLKSRITPDPVDTSEWERWWGRVQPRLEHDERIDATRSREKRYRLLREGERAIESIGPVVQAETRRGRLLATAPQLREARKIARRARPRSSDEDALISAEITLAERTDVDPTDRFMAAELALWVGRLDPSTATELLAADISQVDLLRIPQAESRDRALAWGIEAIDRDRHETWTVLRSAAAAGPPWSELAAAEAGDAMAVLRAIGEGYLGWSVPGSEDAGQHKYPDDLDIFDRRIDRARDALASAGPVIAHGVMVGALRALETLPEAKGLHSEAWDRVMTRIATTAWIARERATTKPRLDAIGLLRPAAIMALVRTAGSGVSETLDLLVNGSYRAQPMAYASTFTYYWQSRAADPVAKALELVRHSLAGDPLRVIAALALQWAVERDPADPIVPEAASLAAAIAPEERSIRDRLDGLAVRHANALLDLKVVDTAAWFSHASWTTFANRIIGRLEEAYAREHAAEHARDELRAELEKAQTALSLRTEALSTARGAAGAERRDDAQRQSAALLKPVAAAIADSYEADSLPALRDRLIAILARARMKPIGSVREVQPFDAERHEWVGDGLPGDEVQLLSPGFALMIEGEDDVVLVPARVVAAR